MVPAGLKSSAPEFLEALRAFFPPAGAMMHHPTYQRLLKADVLPGILRFQPLVAHNLIPLGEKLAI